MRSSLFQNTFFGIVLATALPGFGWANVSDKHADIARNLEASPILVMKDCGAQIAGRMDHRRRSIEIYGVDGSDAFQFKGRLKEIKTRTEPSISGRTWIFEATSEQSEGIDYDQPYQVARILIHIWKADRPTVGCGSGLARFEVQDSAGEIHFYPGNHCQVNNLWRVLSEQGEPHDNCDNL